jgi:peptidoglycan/LPS O-acetylase OafA/YrhL
MNHETDRLTSLDGLRGVAALAVVLFHWWHFFCLNGEANAHENYGKLPLFWLFKPFYTQGWAGVDFFFVLSGFVFFWLYADRIRKKQIDASHFALLRISRLFPLQIVTLIIVAVVQMMFVHVSGKPFIYPRNDALHFVQHFFLVQNWWPHAPPGFNAPSWSVSVECLLYIIFFVACRFGLRRPFHIAIIALFSTVFLLVDMYIGRGLVGFFLGGLTFCLWNTLRKRADVRKIARGLAALSCAIWITVLIFLYADPSTPNDWSRQASAFLLPLIFGLAPLTVLTIALNDATKRSTRRVFAFLGDISYAVYLLHFPLQAILALGAVVLGIAPAFFMQAWVMGAFFVLLIGLSSLSYYGFEQPMQLWIRGWAHTSLRRSPAI